MNKTQTEHFAISHCMPISVAKKLFRLHNRAGQLGEYICNGEPHHADNASGEKQENSQLWQREQDKLDKEILCLIKPYGFEGIEYNGLWPTLRKGGRDVYITD